MKLPLILTLVPALLAQSPGPLPLDFLREALPLRSAFSAAEIVQLVEQRGIAFDVSEAALGTVIEYSAKGERRHAEVAQIAFALLRACPACRSGLYPPLERREIAALLKKGLPSDAVLREVRERGTRDVPATRAFEQELQASGASAQLIRFLVPEDRLPLVPPPGYKLLGSKAGAEQNREGIIVVNVEVGPSGRAELFFAGDALFLRDAPGVALREPGSHFSRRLPADVRAEQISADVQASLVESGTKKVLGKKDPKPEVRSITAPGGTPGLSFSVSNLDKRKPRNFELTIRWAIGGTVRPAAPPART